MTNKLIKTLVCLLLSAVSIAQTKFAAQPIENRLATPLTQLKKYSLFHINAAAVSQFSKLQKEKIEFQLELPGLVTWDLSITENDILAKDYFLSVTTTAGKVNLPKPECMTYRGTLLNDINSRVSLTITNDLIYGMIRSNQKEYFIEPLRYLITGSATDLYVVYETKDVQYDPSLTCGVTEMQTAQQKILPPTGYENAGLNCVQNELAIASDASMFTRYGSAVAVQAHNIGVINNVIWDYMNAQFNNNIEIVIVTQNISTVAGTDQLSPLYAGTNSGTVLNNFRTWGEAGNFGVAYDNAEFWTTRDLDNDGAGGSNGIVGLAYVGVICTPSRYHILEDFAGSNPTGSGYLLRVLTSHEMGHNFNCSHDAAGSPYIMAPTVQNTVTWSAASIASADAHVGSRGCLAQCSTSGLPVADFIANPGAICTGGTIQLVDHSLHGPTSWSWTFTGGGSPGSSVLRNPAVSFATNGIKNISLTSTNGNGSHTKAKLILVSNGPAVACSNTGTGASNAGVNSFSLANINKITAGLATDGNEYMDFSCSDLTMLSANTTYSVTVNVGTTVPSNEFNLVQLFIDYNNDGDFADANEAVYSSPGCYIGNHTFTFNTPASPMTNQLLRTRVIAKDCIGGVNSCYNVTAGQVEDYSVFFPDAALLSTTLLSFEGYHRSGKNHLYWQTTADINNSYFDIERSVDGISYESIGRVNAISFSGSYTFIDELNGISGQRFYYRLKIAEHNGNFKNSHIVTLDRGIFNELTVYPNPVKRGEALHIGSNINADKIEIINSLGQRLYSKAGSFNGNISIPVSLSWAPGQYLVRIMNSVKIVTQKILIQ